MSDEIKEILDYLKIENGHCSSELSYDETHLLLDYITNLQEENEEFRLLKERYQLIKEIYKERINKAIEYINKHCVNERISKEVGYKCYTMADTNELEKIIKILGGGIIN